MATPKGFSIFVSIGASLLPSLGASTNAVVRKFDGLNRKLRIQAAESKAALKEIASAAEPLVALAASGGLLFGSKSIFGASADFAHQQSQLRLAGRSAREVAQATAAAYKAITDVPTSKMSDNLAMVRETTLAFGSFQHAVDNLGFNQKISSLLNNQFGDGFASPELFNKLVKAIEIRGGKVSTPEYQKLATGMYRAISVSGGTVTPDDYLGFVQQSSPYARGYSDDFFMNTAPSLIGEMGGERVGTALAAIGAQLHGRVGLGGKAISQNWQRYGLLKPGAKLGSNGSKNSWTIDDVVGNGLADSDPYTWFGNVVIPALKKHGIDLDNKSQVLAASVGLFGRATGQRMASTFLDPTQRARIDADRKLTTGAMGVDEAYKWSLSNDPKMAWKAIGASMNALALELGRIFAKPAVITGILAFARVVASIAEWFGKHPIIGGITTGTMALGGLAGIAKMLGLFRLAGSIWKLLFKVGPRETGIVGAAFRFLFKSLPAAIGEAFVAVVPVVAEGFAAIVAAVAAAPLWVVALIAVAVVAAGAFIFHFRKQIWAGIVSVGSAIKNFFLSTDWSAIGMTIADSLTFGLASRVRSALSGIGAKTPAGPPVVKPAGARARGGPVTAGVPWLVGERGAELFVPSRSGTIIPHSELERRRAMKGGGVMNGATVIIQDSRDPDATARAVRRELMRLGAEQNAALHD